MWTTSELLAVGDTVPGSRFLYTGQRRGSELVPTHRALGLLQVADGEFVWREVARFRYWVPGVEEQIQRCSAMGTLPNGQPRMTPVILATDEGFWGQVVQDPMAEGGEREVRGSEIGAALMLSRLD